MGGTWPALCRQRNRTFVFNRGDLQSFPEGGSWTLRLKKSPLLSKIWEELVLACIGEAFDDPHDVVGVVVSVRQKEDVISIWNKDGRNRISLGCVA